MAISRAQRRREREPRAEAIFGREASAAALDLLELVEMAWHDCYGEISPSEDQVDDMLVLSEGEIAKLVRAALLRVTDPRDLKLVAEARRRRP